MGTISTLVSMDVLLIAGGTMPSHSLLLNFQSSLQLVDQVTFDMIEGGKLWLGLKYTFTLNFNPPALIVDTKYYS